MGESLSLAAIDMHRGAPNGHNTLAMLARIYGIETELREFSNDERRVGFAPHRKRSRPALTLAEQEEISLGLARQHRQLTVFDIVHAKGAALMC